MTFKGSEKRMFPRKSLRARVVFEDETGEGFVYFYSTDVSLGGLFFETDVPLKLGTRVFLSFALSDGEAPVRATGQVVRIEREPQAGLNIVGVGIQFSDLSQEARRVIESYLSS